MHRLTMERDTFRSEVRDGDLEGSLRILARTLTSGSYRAEVVPYEQVSEKQFIKGLSSVAPSLVLYHGGGDRWTYTYGVKKSDMKNRDYTRYFQWFHSEVWGRHSPTSPDAGSYVVVTDHREEVASLSEFLERLTDHIGWVHASMEFKKANEEGSGGI